MPSLKSRLDRLLREQDPIARREADPVAFVHRFARVQDQEIVGLIASLLAFGNIVAVQKSIARVLDVLGPEPARGAERSRRSLRAGLKGFVHRVYRGDHLADLIYNAGRLQREAGTLGDAFAFELERASFRDALAAFANALRRPARGVPSRNMRHLVPDPHAGSACKRLLLYLRWMVRPADGVDLGLWPVEPAQLVVPVDTHIQRIAHNLRLTERKDASWRTAEEITAALRRFDPHDPVKYDFALCHLGVSRACPSKRSDDACAACVLQPACRHWT